MKLWVMLYNYHYHSSASSHCHNVHIQVVDERGKTYKATAFFGRIKLRGRCHPALFTAGHVFDPSSGVDSKSLSKVHLIFNNMKVWRL